MPQVIIIIFMGILSLSPLFSVQADTVFFYPALEPADTLIPHDRDGKELPEEVTLYSTADNAAFRAVLKGFQAQYPTIRLTYHELQSQTLYQRVIDNAEAQRPNADLVISSAMDLQMKLANDGYAGAVHLDTDADLPDWAMWRDEAFGTTFEPVVIIYNKKYFSEDTIPKTRIELVDYLRQAPQKLAQKFGTYDIEKSGVGYLFLARDSDHNNNVWELTRLMAEQGLNFYTGSSAMIDDVGSGKLALAYNVLGSYAANRLHSYPDLGILLPQDYTIVLSRIALVPKNAQNPEAGALFLSFLLSERGQRLLAETGSFNAIHPRISGSFSASALYSQANNSLRPLNVRPSLLVYLDQMKREAILQRWRRVTQQIPSE